MGGQWSVCWCCDLQALWTFFKKISLILRGLRLSHNCQHTPKGSRELPATPAGPFSMPFAWSNTHHLSLEQNGVHHSRHREQARGTQGSIPPCCLRARVYVYVGMPGVCSSVKSCHPATQPANAACISKGVGVHAEGPLILMVLRRNHQKQTFRW